MKMRPRCNAQIVAMNQLGEGVAYKICQHSPDGKHPCALAELAERGYVVTPRNTPCMAGYPDNMPRHVERN